MSNPYINCSSFFHAAKIQNILRKNAANRSFFTAPTLAKPLHDAQMCGSATHNRTTGIAPLQAGKEELAKLE